MLRKPISINADFKTLNNYYVQIAITFLKESLPQLFLRNTQLMLNYASIIHTIQLLQGLKQ